MKTVIELAKQAGWEYADDDRGFEPLWQFAELVRADEREACALLIEENVQECSGPMGLVLQANADAIRAKGQS